MLTHPLALAIICGAVFVPSCGLAASGTPPGAEQVRPIVLCYALAHERMRARCRAEIFWRGSALRTIEVERLRVERRQSAVAEIRQHLTELYRGFVGWASLYGDADDHDERERRARVVLLLDDLSKQYLPRSVWLMEGNRKKIENFVSRAEVLCSEFSAEIEEQGYHRVRRSMEKRVSKKLRPLKTEAESGLEAELSEPRRPGWRERLRGQ
jgi:hypothetical protein